jgi:hypothetical protein
MGGTHSGNLAASLGKELGSKYPPGIRAFFCLVRANERAKKRR